MSTGWEKIGECGVDSGTIIIGDPCYYMDGKLTQKEVYDGNFKSKELKYEMGHAGKGVIINEFGGDGVFPVFIKRDSDGLITEATIRFQ